jgi:hypothetical protein
MATPNRRFTIERELKKTLRDCAHFLQKIDARAEFYPRRTDELVSYDALNSDADIHSFNFAPLVCLLPERAQKKPRSIYVVLSGYLALSVDSGAPFDTVRFGTRVGYFRSRDSQLVHVLGLHYDFDEVLANHPVYHAQLGSQIEFVTDIENAMKRPQANDPIDMMADIFGGSRIPTAQLDFFSAMAQIGADHLLSKDGPPEAQSAFKSLTGTCATVSGSGSRHSRFARAQAEGCYRGEHWYGSEDL